MKLGSTPVNDLKLGSQQVQKVYLGTQLIWQKVAAPLTLRPISDRAGSSWITAPLWSKVNEELDTTFIQGGLGTSAVASMNLPAVTANPATITVKFRARKSGGSNNNDMQVMLAASGSISTTFTINTTSWANYEWQVPVTNFTATNNYYIQFTSDSQGGNSSRHSRPEISRVEVYITF